MRTVSRNNPIATVIKNYVNKKSGKVTDSRNEIQRRFFGLDWKDQKKIMAAFLDSGISDRDWAYSRLLDLWDASFEPQVLKLWETYHEEKCAWVIIRHFPKEFIKGYFYIACAIGLHRTDIALCTYWVFYAADKGIAPPPIRGYRQEEGHNTNKIMRVLNAFYQHKTDTDCKEPMPIEVFKERKKVINELSKA